MFNLIKRIFSKIFNRGIINNPTDHSNQSGIPKRKQYKPVNIIPKNYDDSKLTILLLEDFNPFIDVIKLELSAIIDLAQVNLIIANTQYGAVNALLALDTIKVDFAYCDITLGGLVFMGDQIKEYDGVDVVEKILINNRDAKFKLLTGHNLQSDNLEITDAVDKFNAVVQKLKLDISIESVYINKRSSRADMYYELINSINEKTNENAIR